tara:strand:- start:7137 stop:7781 length:645 start_codon:yes stop_codon:yes gene_type:complete
MENKYEIRSIFPTPLYITLIPQSLSSILSYFDSQKPAFQHDQVKLNYGTRSANSYILNDPPCLELSNYILSNVLNYGSKYLSYAYTQYKLTQSWVSQKHPGESHIVHTHANSLISGVLYYGDMDSNTPHINFHNPNTKKFLKMRPKINHEGYNLYTTPQMPLIPTPGMLILFPSTLPHSVPENITNKVRKSLAFNVVPLEGFGAEEELTELKIN